MTRQIADNVTLLSMNVEGLLFEGMWNMPRGVTLNSYIIKGEKTAIVDGFCGWDGVPETLYKLLDEADVELDSIRYLIINHMEPDHSGWIESFQKMHSNFEVWCTKEAAELLKAFYNFQGKIHTITDDETLDLGGRVLRFKKTPNIHWPDTMMTFDEKTGCLFTCDAFGSFGKVDQHFASENEEKTMKELDREQLRYFAAILNTFAPFVLRGIQKIENLPIKMICPGHGLVWDTPDLSRQVMEAHKRYVEYARGEAKPQIAMLYGSMYGNTQKMAEIARDYLKEKGVPVVMLQVPGTDMGTILMHTLESKGLVVGSPTYEYKMFPPMAATLEEMGRKMVGKRKAVYFGSYGWSGGCKKEYMELVEQKHMKYDSLGETEFRGAPTEESIKDVKATLDRLIEAIQSETAST